MTDTITYDQIERYEYDNLFELVDNRTNVPDPRNRPSTKPYVYDYDPLDSVEESVDFNVFPHIVVGLPFEVSESNKSVSGSIKRYTWKHTITVRASRRGAGNNKPAAKGRNDMNDISSSLHKFFNTPSIRKSFRDVKMENIVFNKISSDTNVYNSTEYYEAEFELEFSVRLTVIA